MTLRFSSLIRSPLVVCAMAVVLRPAQAQTQEPIIFSAPDTNAPSLAPRSPLLPDFDNPDQQQLNFSPAPAMPEPSVPAISPDQAADREKDWTLMTPEEIFGLPTAEKILGVSERDAMGEQKNQTAAERFFAREQLQADNDHTNGRAIFNLQPEWSFSNRNDFAKNPGGFFSEISDSQNPLGNSMFNQTRVPAATAATAMDSAWSKVFNAPAPTPAGATEQLATDEAFKRLLEPHSTPAAKPVFPPTPAPQDSLFAEPAANSIGVSHQPLNSVEMPEGVKPLPGLTQQTDSSTTPVAPEWQPQLPPWMSPIPQPGAVPQRKF